MDSSKLKDIVEAALLAAGRPLGLEQLQALFAEHERPERADLKAPSRRWQRSTRLARSA
jgi:segregation and condensation protein B